MKILTKILLFFAAFSLFSTTGYSEEASEYQVNAISSGNLTEAEQGLLAVLEKDPDDPYALLNLAYVYQKAGDDARAQDIYNRILTLKTNPYAELASGKPERVKTIARRGIAQVATE